MKEINHYITSKLELSIELVRCSCGWTDYVYDLEEAEEKARQHKKEIKK